MIVVLMIIIMIVAVNLIKDAAYETKIMHSLDKTADQNWNDLKEHYRKQGINLK